MACDRVVQMVPLQGWTGRGRVLERVSRLGPYARGGLSERCSDHQAGRRGARIREAQGPACIPRRM
eukprot:12806447-Alexandrium_andersonii.AAC.1